MSTQGSTIIQVKIEGLLLCSRTRELLAELRHDCGINLRNKQRGDDASQKLPVRKMRLRRR